MSLSDQVSCFENPRSVVNNVLTQAQPEGDGGVLRRGFRRPELEYLDPFLQLDEYTEPHPTANQVHLHRGFETVTLMLEGAFTHKDFAGYTGTVHKGDVQWMTAGRGIIHSEKPVNEETQKRLQIWINLPSKDKCKKCHFLFNCHRVRF